MSRQTQARPLFDPPIVRRAIVESFRKLNPRRQLRNPVMFTVLVGSVMTTALWVQALSGKGEAPARFIFSISLWLWFTVLFANFAEAMAEGRGKAQADALAPGRQDVMAKKLKEPQSRRAAQIRSRPRHCAKETSSWSRPATRFRPTAK